MYTTHGHQIMGTTATYPKPSEIARCGGPGLCDQCSREAACVSKVSADIPSVEIQSLIGQLGICITQIDNQILEIVKSAGEMGCTPSQVRTPKGEWVMVDLLSAKANALNALTYLKGGNNAGDTYHATVHQHMPPV